MKKITWFFVGILMVFVSGYAIGSIAVKYQVLPFDLVIIAVSIVALVLGGGVLNNSASG